jgi:anti-sigma B factor antagonist
MAPGEAALAQAVPRPPESASDGLHISERDQDGVRIVRVSGDLDLDAAVPLCARVDAARAAGCRLLLLDLTQLRFCDSSGLRALIRAAEEVFASAGRVAVVPPADGPVVRVFALTGAHEFLPVQPSVAEGVASLANRR